VASRGWTAWRRPFATRRAVLIALAVALVGALATGLALSGGNEPAAHRAVAGSRLGAQDPFDIRRPSHLLSAWSADFTTDPTELLVDRSDAFVVTPNEVTDLATDDGRQRWRADVKDAEPYIAADATTVLVAAGDGFEALDRSTGRSRWRVGIDDPADIGRAVGLVHVGGEEVAVAMTEFGGVVGLDGATGAVRWSVAVKGTPRGRIAVDDATGAVATLTNDADHVALRVFDAGTGAVRWARTLERDTGVPTIVGDLLVVGTSRDETNAAITGLALVDGSERWRIAAEEGFEATTGPAIHGSTLVFADKLGTLRAIRADSGTVRWTTHLPGPVLADSPAIAHGLVVIHDTFAQVHTVELRTGRIVATRDSIGVPLGIGAGPDRIVYAQSGVAHGQVMGYAPAALARPVVRMTGRRAAGK
ncbi:MAG: PQQ-binding-like beta-propeller repeat protein, partial [Acidimicrobiia bacterium]